MMRHTVFLISLLCGAGALALRAVCKPATRALDSRALGARTLAGRSLTRARSTPDDAAAAPEDAAPEPERAPEAPSKYDVSKLVGGADKGGGFNQFDPVLTGTQFLSRRFGIAGGLAIFGVLFVVEGDEILRALGGAEPLEGANELVTLPSGLKYTESLIGRAGDSPLPGAVVAFKARVSVGQKVIYDTAGEKPVAFKYGQRPFQNIICEGVEEGIRGAEPRRDEGRPRSVGPQA